MQLCAMPILVLGELNAPKKILQILAAGSSARLAVPRAVHAASILVLDGKFCSFPNSW